MASITSWVRLEPRTRDRELAAGAEARLHDPLWSLARQWQLGELSGADAGSAITARARLEVARVDAVRTPGTAWTAFDPDRAPLDVVLSRDPADIARRVRAGRQLQRMLAGTPATADLMLAKFPFQATPQSVDDDDARRFAAAMAGRVVDGDLAAATLGPLLANGDLPADFGVASADIASVSTTCRAWLAAHAPLVTNAWQPDQLAYRFDVRAPTAGTDVSLTATRHARGGLAWYDVDAIAGDANTRSTDAQVSTAVPTHVSFRGCASRRYWDLEDSAVSWQALAASPGDAGRLLVIELGLTFGDHWLVMPVEVPAGSISRVASLVVTDTFGVRILVRTPEELDGATTPWRFCELSRDAGMPGPWLFVMPAASSSNAGPATVAFDLASDDVADVLWAIDRTIVGSDGRPRTAVAAPAGAATVGPGAYQLGPAIPSTYHAYREQVGTSGLELVRATVPGAALDDRPDLPARIAIGALPARPVQLRATPTVVRSSDGSYHLVVRDDVGPTTLDPLTTLAFDQVSR